MATITDPITGKQFTVGGAMDASLNTSQAYQRAMAAAGMSLQSGSKTSPVTGDSTFFTGLMPVSTFNPGPSFNEMPMVSESVMTGIPTGTAPVAAQMSMPVASVPGGTGDIISNLPLLRSSGGGGESQIDPSLRPYLEMGLQRAEQLFFGQQQPTLYPGQMYVSPSQQTLDALAAQEAAARASSPVLGAAQTAYTSGLSGLGQTAGGSFLMGSPFQQAAIQAATRPLQQQFAESTLPALQSAFSKAGRYGSGAQAQAIGRAQEGVSTAIGNIAAQMANQQYAAERQLQQQAQASLPQLAAQAGTIYGQQYLPAQQLAQAGAAQEQIAQAPLQEAMTRYQFAQQLPYQQLQSFLSGVYGTPLGSSVYQSPAQTNQVAQYGGLLLGAAGLVPEATRTKAFDYLAGLF